MKEVQVKVTKYVCENCGKQYSNKTCIHECAISGKEICDGCSVVVGIIPTEIYGDELRYADAETEKRLVSKEYSGCEWDEERYWEVARKVKELYIKRMAELNLAYGKGKITEFLDNYPEYKES